MKRRTVVVGILGLPLMPLAGDANAGPVDEVNDIIKSLAPIDGQSLPRRDPVIVREPVVVERQTIYVDTTRHIDLEVYFDYDSAVITRRAEATLQRLGEALQSSALSGFRYLIAGHTDAVGSDAYNVELSRRRARAVYEYLISEFAIDPDRLMSVGFGFRRLKDPQHPRAAINRRVEILLIVP